MYCPGRGGVEGRLCTGEACAEDEAEGGPNVSTMAGGRLWNKSPGSELGRGPSPAPACMAALDPGKVSETE